MNDSHEQPTTAAPETGHATQLAAVAAAGSVAPATTGTAAGPSAEPVHPAASAVPAGAPIANGATSAPPAKPLWRKLLSAALLLAGLALGGYWLYPSIITALNTVSTDDAYVNGHVTFVAPRVPGQVSRVFVDDNYRVKKGDVLVQLDKEPYQVQVDIRKAAVTASDAELTSAQSRVRALFAQVRSNRFKLDHVIQTVSNEVANLRAAVATLSSRKATLELAKANLRRGEELAPTGSISKEDLDQRRQSVKVDQAGVDQALQQVVAIRVNLGLPAEPEGGDLTEVPTDLDQNFSVVRQALADVMQIAAQFGYYPPTLTAPPREAIDDFYKLDPEGNLDRIFEHLIPEAPAIKEAEAKLMQARRDLEQAELNLRYCDVVSEIDGVVTRRNVNPGNNVQAGQSVMAVRSLTSIWIDANFKETQLADLRIGQRALCKVDMYGRRMEFEGRITGFTMGTGQTLALLPPQNATGNFVKIVQRLPVRIELTDYHPDENPLFVGLSVVPYVYFKEPASGPEAGRMLRPYAPVDQTPTAE